MQRQLSQLDLNTWQTFHVYTKSKAPVALLFLNSVRSVYMSYESVFSPTSCSYHPCDKRATSAPQRPQWTGTLWPPTGLWTTCTLLRMWASLKTWGESSISFVQIVRLDQSAGTVWTTRKVSTSLWKGWIMHSVNAYVSPKELVLAGYASFPGFTPSVDHNLIHHTQTYILYRYVYCLW